MSLFQVVKILEYIQKGLWETQLPHSSAGLQGQHCGLDQGISVGLLSEPLSV